MMKVECLGLYRRDVRNDDGKQLLSFATNCKLALINPLFSTRKGGMSHTHDGTSPNDRKRTDYILARQAHQPRVHYVKVVPQPPPPAKAGSDHNISYIKVPIGDHFCAQQTKYEYPRNAESSTGSILCPMKSFVDE